MKGWLVTPGTVTADTRPLAGITAITRAELSGKRLCSVKPVCRVGSDPGAHATMSLMSESSGLWALFASSFLAATLLPGGSEFVLAAVVGSTPHQYWPALIVATVGNTLGGMSSYLIGRLIPRRENIKGAAWVQRYGSPVLLASWLPIIGDPLCVAAGWLRLNPAFAALWMACGKFARYAVVANIAS